MKWVDIMKIEAFTVCIDYSDCLKQTLSNKNQIDNWIIITHSKDFKTIRLCLDNHIRYVFCDDDIYHQGSLFAKGRAINTGVSKSLYKQWLIQLDGDILLPDNFRENLRLINLDRDCIYGCQRVDNTGRGIVEPAHMFNGRMYSESINGYFQLWHHEKMSTYPETSGMADVDDIIHAHKFDYDTQWKFLDFELRDVNSTCSRWTGDTLRRSLRI